MALLSGERLSDMAKHFVLKEPTRDVIKGRLEQHARPATECPGPVGAAEHRRAGSEKREDCLSDRRERVPQRRFRAEKRRAPGAQRRASLRVPFLLVPFLWASKEKERACGPPPASRMACREAATSDDGWNETRRNAGETPALPAKAGHFAHGRSLVHFPRTVMPLVGEAGRGLARRVPVTKEPHRPP